VGPWTEWRSSIALILLVTKNVYMTFYMLYADIVCFFHRSEMSTVQIMIQISFDTIQLQFTPFFHSYLAYIMSY
jgi:hypothetical protein